MNNVINNMILAQEDEWHTPNRRPKEVKIFCDPETNTALVRIFKLRNYKWSGGKTFELKKDSDELKALATLIGKDTVWDTSSETAITYQIKEAENVNITL